MEISIFSKTDNEIPLHVSKPSGIKAEDISFENVIKSASSTIGDETSAPGNIPIKPDMTAASKTGQTNQEITAAKENGDLQMPTGGKTSKAEKDKKEFHLSRGLISQNACEPDLRNLDFRAGYSTGEDINVKPSVNETKSITSESSKNPAKPEDRKVPVKAFEEAQSPANISAQAQALSQDEPQSAGVGEKSNKSQGIKTSSDVVDANAKVFKKAVADISMKPNLNNAVVSKRVQQTAEKSIKDSLKDLNAGAAVKGDETFNSENKVSRETLPAEEKGKEAPKADRAPLTTKKSFSREILPAHISLRADELKQGKIDKTSSKESSDTSKNTKSLEYVGKAISNRVIAGDEVRPPVDDAGSKVRLNSGVPDARTVNEPNASTGGGFDSKNEDNSDKKDPVAQTLKVTPGIGQAHGYKISTNPPAAEVRATQSTKEPEVFDKVSDGLKMSLVQGGKEVRLSLHPEHLGKLNIKLTVEDSSVKARIQVDNAEIKGILESDSGRLKEFFSHQGLTLEKYSIELSQPGNNMTANGGLQGGDSWGNNESGGGPYARQDSRTEVLADSRPYGDTSDGTHADLSGIDVFI